MQKNIPEHQRMLSSYMQIKRTIKRKESAETKQNQQKEQFYFKRKETNFSMLLCFFILLELLSGLGGDNENN